MKCPVCGTNEAILDEYYGYLPCQPCQDRQANLKKPGAIPEFTSEDIKNQRKMRKDDIEADHRKGELNKRWLDLYGVKAAKNRGYTDKEIKNAKYVYSGDTTYYRDGN